MPKRRSTKRKEYPVTDAMRRRVQSMLAAHDRMQAWILANPGKPFSEYLNAKR